MGKWERKRFKLRSIAAQDDGYRSDCDGKVRYRDAMEAKSALQRIRAHPREKSPTRYYSCHICKGYHLTSKEETA